MRMSAFATVMIAAMAHQLFVAGFIVGPPSSRHQTAILVHPISWDSLVGKRILVVGGSGRVGGSVVTQLLQRGSRVTVGGTTSDSFRISQARWANVFPDLDVGSVAFRALKREDAESVTKVLTSDTPFDLVVHTAGPFQGKVRVPNGVIAAAVQAKVPYVDVCDDYCTAMAAKANYGTDAQAPCIVSTGCWPGVSSLMAKQLVQKSLQSYPTLTAADLTVKFSFFTAGSGGAGATLLVATFLILAEQALTIVSGRRREVQPMRDYSSVNFGPIVGDKDIAHLNLLETASMHDILGVGNVQSLFGTAPGYWNTLLGLMAQFPSSLLSNEDLMSKLAIFSLPIVRVVDYFAGATNAMRCDVTCSKEPSLKATAIYAHENLEPCVGECVVAFCSAVLSGAVKPGVWFPEEAIDGGNDAAAVLDLASVGAHTVLVEGSTMNLTCGEVWGRDCTSSPSAPCINKIVQRVEQ
jgi:hypothetical protein